MTLTSEMYTAPAWAGDLQQVSMKGAASADVFDVCTAERQQVEAPRDVTRFGVLLEDPVFAEWATETAARYHVTALEALGAVAEALARDGMSRATQSTESPDLLIHV